MGPNGGKPVIAMDLGGTKIVGALVSPSGQVLDTERAATEAAQGPGQVIERIFTVVDSLLGRAAAKPADLGGVSVAFAGPIDMERGMVSTAPNLPGWDSVPLRELIGDKYRVDSYLVNDAKAAALGEHEFGAGKGTNNMLCIMLGTGVGGGIIADGKLYLGQSGAAGEVGHMTIDVDGPRCSCGNVGCWEMFASGTAMEREAVRRLEAGGASSLRRFAEKGANGVTAQQIALAAADGDALAQDVIAWSAGHLGTGLVNLVHIFNPELIVIGGGLSKIGRPLLEPAIGVVRQRAFPLHSRAVRIVPSRTGDDAGVLGAAAFAFRRGRA